ncbi:hypothetical protein ACLK1T_01495 [Escherichia coli]
MELKATTLGKHLAQHPYNGGNPRCRDKSLRNRHEYLIPFNQFLAIHLTRYSMGRAGIVLPDEKVVRLHGTEWGETQRFYHRLDAHWRRWSGEVERNCVWCFHASNWI